MKISRTLVLALLLVAAERPLFAAEAEKFNRLTPAESKAGWQLLFDGRSTTGWRGYRQDTVGAGWQAVDGTLSRVEDGAGDLITQDQYGSFELSLEYQISPGGNSGVMFHVTEEGEESWHTGPEIQILDNAAGSGSQKAGWLYDLYPASTDATRPAGQWNHLHLRVTPEQCEINLNGVRYARFVKGSPDWQRRVARSKFAELEHFGQASEGHICLQDHGDDVAFRNIKIRRLTPGGPVPEPIDGKLALRATNAFPQLRWQDWSPIDDEGRPQPLRPIFLTHAGDGTNRIFVIAQRGVIHVFENRPDATETQVFLDIRKKTTYHDTKFEEGLLGLAFHPHFKENGEFFIYYTDPPQQSVISRFRVSKTNPNRADPSSEEELLRVKQPFWNHNGGTLCFGPDGYLYVGFGDGGSANDPLGNGQNLRTLLGAVLRIDVNRKDAGQNYAIPADNPFAGRDDARGEIWAYGIRNPWRMAFDRKTGDFWVADVGQNLWEEINLIVRGGNYGWNLREGAHSFGAEAARRRDDLIEPIWEYDHQVGASITGGTVYRGSRLPELHGAYLYGDFVSGKLWALKYDPKKEQLISNHSIPGPPQAVTAFGEDEQGEVYFTVVTSNGEGIYRFERTNPGD